MNLNLKFNKCQNLIYATMILHEILDMAEAELCHTVEIQLGSYIIWIRYQIIHGQHVKAVFKKVE